MPYITNPLNGKQMYRSPDRDYKKKMYVYYSILFLFIMLDVYVSRTVQINPHYLDVMVALLSPVSWLFNKLGVPITSGFLEGPQPPVYYHVLMLNSALLGVVWGVALAYGYCKRCRFFRYPAYGAKLAYRNTTRHPVTKVFTINWFYWIFSRSVHVTIVLISVITILYVYPGRVTFNTSGFVMPIIISIMPATIWSFSPFSLLCLISFICSDIDSIQRR